MSALSSIPATAKNGDLEVLWEDGERVFCRTWRRDSDGRRYARIAVLAATDPPMAGSVDRLVHEFGLRNHLDSAWALRPLELVREPARTMLILESPGGEPLDGLVGSPMEVGQFLRIAVGLSAALRGLHEGGLVHKDIKPSNVVVDATKGKAWLTGFGIASRLPRERQSSKLPEFIAGTFAYMAPEQTGRMNRSIDSRSDLYALGVTLYQMLTGSLPFTAADPMDWVHCHIARKPAPPSERMANVPTAVSAIIMKLLAKAAEERYQTAAGLEHDLQQCRGKWNMQGRIDEFPLAAHDVPDRLLIPEKLYGRTREVATLLSSFQRVVTTGTPELVLVSGYSGIGKSSVVNELHKVLVPFQGLFASGKFDQYVRDIPYATLAQAFQSLVRQILSKSEVELRHWRDALHEALGPNGLLMVDLIPELELVIGEQPPVPDLSPQDAQRRFQRVLRRFIGVFARPEHPLALLLDDLQWLDAATIDLLEDLLAQQDTRHLLLIGVYRDNEVNSAHPLMRKLDTIRQSSTTVQDIVLAPLNYGDLAQLIVDSLCCESKRASPLVQLVHEKTAGNPFFAIQFLHTLADEALLTFDHGEARWCWDLDRIHAKGYTDNVADLMVVKLNRLPAETQTVLRQLACVGPSAEFALLGTVCQTSQEELHESLWEAVRSGLVHRSENSYGFQHDRVQEAAYSRIPEKARAEAHLQIGRLLIAHTPPDKREEIVFEIVSQFNRSTSLITSRDEREQLARLNLIAGKRAKNAVAYSSALTHFAAGHALLTEDCWTLQYPLTFELEFHRAECEFLTGDLASAEERLSALSSGTANLVDLAAVTCLRVDLYAVLGRSDRAVAVCLEYLQHVGVEWSPHPTDEDVRREYERIWQRIGSRPIEDLIDLPLMNDAGTRATMDVLTKVMPSTMCTDDKLLCLIITRMVNLSLEFGNSNASCCGYVWFGLVLSSYFNSYPAARRFGQLSLDLVERRGLDAFKSRVYEAFGIFVNPWTQHIRSGRAFIQRAFSEANRIGDLTYAVYCCNNFVTNSLAYGERLSEVERESTEGIDFALKADFGLVVDIILGQLCLIRTLRGLTRNFNSFDDTKFDERKFEEHLEADPNLAIAACWYWIRKLQARVFAQDYSSALEAAAKAQTLLWTSPAFFEQAEYHFYAALARAASFDIAEAEDRPQHFDALMAHHGRVDEWARNCAENFETRAALLKAEIARIEGREFEAVHLYEQAIRSAQENGFIHNEALANELAARFYAARGLEKIARAYLRDARQCYLRWGADGKVRQLDQLHPHLRVEEPMLGPSSTIVASVENLDLATVIKVSQAVSGEIVLEKLLETLMRTAIAQAGAERGLLILPRGDEQRLAALASTEGDAVFVHLLDDPLALAALPTSIIHFVVRTGEPVLLDDALAQSPFAADEYLRQRQARSVLCLPLVNQSKLIGVLYLENNLAPRVFTPTRIAALKLLASQAAVALENARLYRDVAEREARIRRLVDANIIGTYIWKVTGQSIEVGDAAIVEANDAFLRMIGYEREDLAAGLLSKTFLSAPEGRDRDAHAAAEVNATGAVLPFEKEYLRKDGTRVPVLIGLAAFDEGRREGFAFVVDLTERRRAEAEARESERRYREVQAALAHAGRVATMGLITASIAHEVSQPVSGAITNAHTALGWLSARTPDIKEATQALNRIIRDGSRAREVIERIRALTRKAPARKDLVELNGALREVIELTRSESIKNGISVRLDLTDGLPVVLGDRVQLQQVMLNLVVNAIESMNGASDGPRELLVTTGKEGLDDVLVAVQDSGPGVTESAFDRLFDAFHTTKPGGLGLGLSISRSIIEAHGGRLRASANAPRGAVFQFTVPATRMGDTMPAP